MMPEVQERVIAAVPVYNAGVALLRLAEQLANQEFDDVYILDDCSTDDAVRRLADGFPAFHIVSGKENRGPAANRNRILEAVQTGLIVFIDADMSLETSGAPVAVKRALGTASVGLAGGFILNEQRQPMGWNYGFEMHPARDARFNELADMMLQQGLPGAVRRALGEKLRAMQADYHWVQPELFPLQRRAVDWVAEGLFAVRAELFQQVGGYDENMPHHEGQDLARRIRDAGKEVVFDPSFSAVHQEVDVRGSKRQRDFREAQFYFFAKHWGMSRSVFDLLYP